MTLFLNNLFMNLQLLSLSSLTVQKIVVAVLMVAALVSGLFIIVKEAKKLGIQSKHIYKASLITIIVGLIGGRLINIIFDFENIYQNANDFQGYLTATLNFLPNSATAGITSVGCIIFGAIFLAFYGKRNKIHTRALFDAIVPGVLFAQVILTFTFFFFNFGEGSAINQSFLTAILPNFIVDHLAIGTQYAQPIFLYEALLLMAGFIVALIVRRLRTRVQTGELLAFYFVWVGLTYAILTIPFSEGMLSIRGIPVVQFFGYFMTIFGVIYFLVCTFKIPNRTYHETISYIEETKVRSIVLDLDETILDSELLTLTAFSEVTILPRLLEDFHYTDPREVLDYKGLEKFSKFVIDNVKMAKLHSGIKKVLKYANDNEIEVVVVSKSPTEIVNAKLEYFNLTKYVNRTIHPKGLSLLTDQYNAHNVLLVSTDDDVLTEGHNLGLVTAYAKFADQDLPEIRTDLILTTAKDIINL